MPLGDSITEITCWRALVWDQLVEANLSSQVRYVGSQNSNPQNCKPTTTNWDQHHEGHSGWLAIDIANSYIDKWSKSTPMDIVMFSKSWDTFLAVRVLTLQCLAPTILPGVTRRFSVVLMRCTWLTVV